VGKSDISATGLLPARWLSGGFERGAGALPAVGWLVEGRWRSPLVAVCRCDTQGDRDVRGGYSDHDPQQDDLAVRGGQCGAQRTEAGALTRVNWLLSVLAGICGRREDSRWRHRCPHKGSATARTGRRTHPANPLRVPAAGRWIRWGRGPPEFVLASPRECPPCRKERSEPAG
jgi:hypothetical protein